MVRFYIFKDLKLGLFCILHMEFNTIFNWFHWYFIRFQQATFEAFVGIRDDTATSQVKLFGDQLQVISLISLRKY